MSLAAFAQPSGADKNLEDAVAVLRGIDGEKLSEAEQKAKAKAIDDSWTFLISLGPSAAVRLKEEIRKVEAGSVKDDFFKLNAAVVIWNIGKASEAKYIADLWSRTPQAAQYNYVFYTAFEAARSQDPAVVPMLRAVLRDDKGSIYVGAHAMQVAWPLSHEFIWGVYGPAGLPALAEAVEKSEDEVELASAMALLAKAQYLPALPRIRQLAGSTRPHVRRHAIKTLGIYGHPSDYDLLISGLKSTDPADLFYTAFALYEFEDERAVPHLIPLLANTDDNLRVEAALALLHLLTPESLAAVKVFVSKLSHPQMKAFLARSLASREEKLPKDYTQKSRDEQARILDSIRNANLIIPAGEKPITNAQLLDMLTLWKKNGRIYNGGADWPGHAKAIAAAKPENIESLLAAKAAFYRRLSDEALYETKDLDTVVKYVGRSRYRLGTGITKKAESR
jgi:hypothetical protein